MRNIRNPRYAPEFLERKLSPSALLGGLAAVAVVSNASLDPTTSIDVPPAAISLPLRVDFILLLPHVVI